MEYCFDDRNVQIVPNAGIPLAELFNDAMDVIKEATNGFRDCKGNLSEISRLVEMQRVLNGK